MAKQLNVNLAFTADTSKASTEIKSLQNQLTQLMNNAMRDSSSLGLTKDIKEATTAVAQLKAQLNNATSSTGKLDLTKFNDSLKASGISLEEYRAKLSALGPEGTAAFSQLASSIASAEIPLKRTNTLVTQLGTTLMNTVKWQLSSSLIHGFVGELQHAFGYAQDLNKSLNDIRIVTGQSSDQMAQFAQKANQAAKELSTRTTDYTNASLIYYQQGLDDKAVDERTRTTLKLANVSRQSAEEVSTQMTAIWNNFDDGTKKLEYYADAITALGAKTASSSSEIAEGLSKFASIADTVGLSYETASAAIATVVAETRQSADTVGNAFKSIFARLQSLKLGETLEDGVGLTKYSEALEKVGVKVLDINGELRDADSIMQDLGQRWTEISDTQKTALAQTVAGQRQYAQFVALFDNWDKVQENIGIASGSEGTLQEQADIYAESWEAAEKRVQASAEAIYDALIDDKFFISFNDGIATILNGVNGLIKGLGGVKGVLATFGALLTRTFSSQIASNIDRVINNITGASVKQAQQLQKDQIASLQRSAEEAALRGSAGGEAQAQALRGQATLQQTLLDNQSRYNAEQLETAQILLDQNEKLRNIAVAEGEALDKARERSKQEKQNELNQAARVAKNNQFYDPAISGDINQNVANARALMDELQNLMNVEQQVESHFMSFRSIINDPSLTPTERFEQLNTVWSSNAQELQTLFNKVNLAPQEYLPLIQILDQLKQHADPILFTKFESELDNIALTISSKVAIAGDDLAAVLERLYGDSDKAAEACRRIIEAFGAESIQGRNAAEALKVLKNDTDNAKKSMESAKSATLTFGQTLSGLSSLTMSLASVINTLKSAYDTLNNDDLSWGEKMLQIIPPLLMSFSMLTNSIMGAGGAAVVTLAQHLPLIGGYASEAVAAGTATAATMTFGNVLKIVFPAVGILTAAIAGLIAVFNFLDEEYETQEEKNKRLEEQLKNSKTAYEDAKTASEDLKSSFDQYQSVRDALDNCTQGTDEWYTALQNVNSQVMTMLDKFPLLASYLTSENGVLGFSEEGMKIVSKQMQQNQNTAMGQYLMSEKAYADNELAKASNNLYSEQLSNSIQDAASSLVNRQDEIAKNISEAELELEGLPEKFAAEQAKENASQAEDILQQQLNALGNQEAPRDVFDNSNLPTLEEWSKEADSKNEALAKAQEEINKSLDEYSQQQQELEKQTSGLTNLYENLSDPSFLSSILDTYAKTLSYNAQDYKEALNSALTLKDPYLDDETRNIQVDNLVNGLQALFDGSPDFKNALSDFAVSANNTNTELLNLATSVAAANLQLDENTSKMDNIEEYYEAAGRMLLSLQEEAKKAYEANPMEDENLRNWYKEKTGVQLDEDFKDESGKTIDVEGFYIADQAAQQLSEGMNDLIAVTDDLEKSTDQADKTFAKVIKGQELNYKDLNNKKLDSREEIQEYLNNNPEIVEATKMLPEQLVNLWLQGLNQAQEESEKVSDAGDDFVQAFLDRIIKGDGWKQAELPIQKTVNDFLKEVANGGSYEALESITTALQNVTAEGFEPLVTLLTDSSIDWNTITDADLVSKLGQITEIFGDAAGIDYSAIINVMKELQSTGEASISERYGEIDKIVSGLSKGSTISAEDYETLGTEITKGYFAVMADGTYKLTKSADEFQEHIKQLTVDDLKSKIQNGDTATGLVNQYGKSGKELFKPLAFQSSIDTEQLKNQIEFLKIVNSEESSRYNTLLGSVEHGEHLETIYKQISKDLKEHKNDYAQLVEASKQETEEAEKSRQKIMSLTTSGRELKKLFDDGIFGENANWDEVFKNWKENYFDSSQIKNIKDYKEALQGVGDQAGMTAEQAKEAWRNMDPSQFEIKDLSFIREEFANGRIAVEDYNTAISTLVSKASNLNELHKFLDVATPTDYSNKLQELLNQDGVGTLQALEEIDTAIQNGKADAELLASILDRILNANDLSDLEKIAQIRERSQQVQIDEYTGKATPLISSKDAGLGLIQLAKESDELFNTDKLAAYNEGLELIGDTSNLTAIEVRQIGQAATEVAQAMDNWDVEQKATFVKEAFGGDNIDPANMRLYADAMTDLLLADKEGNVDETIKNLEQYLTDAEVPAGYLKDEIISLLTSDGQTTSDAIQKINQLLSDGTIQGKLFLDILKGVMENSATPQQQMDILQNNQEQIESNYKQQYTSSGGIPQSALDDMAHQDYLGDVQNVIDKLDASSFETPEAFIEFFDMLPEGVNYMDQLSNLFGSIADKVTSFDQLDKLRDFMSEQGATDKDFQNPENEGWQTAVNSARESEAKDIGVDVETFKNYEDEIYKVIEAQNQLDQSNGEVGKSQQQLEQLSMQMTKSMLSQEQGFDELGSVLKKYSGDLQNVNTVSSKSVEALTKVQQACNKLFNGKVSSNFVKNNLEDIKKAVDNDEEALKRLQIAAAKDYVSGLKKLKTEIADTPEEVEEVEKSFSKLGSAMEEAFEEAENAEIGDEINENFQNSLNEMIASGQMTVDEVNSLLNMMGYDVDMSGLTMAADTAQEIVSQMTDGMGQALEYGTQEFNQAMAGLSGEARAQLQELVQMYMDAGMEAGEAYTAAINNIDTQLAVTNETVAANEAANANSQSTFTMEGTIGAGEDQQEIHANVTMDTVTDGGGDADITLPVLGKGGTSYNGGGAGAGARSSAGGGGGGGGGGCFIAGTLITTKTGFKNIEVIQEGDIVLSFNEKYNKNQYSTVLETMIHVVHEEIYTLYIEDEKIITTGIHKFLITRNNIKGWIQASDLKVGDYVQFADGTLHLITKIDIKVDLRVVYNFEVDGNHNYYVGKNQILAHNKGGRRGRGGSGRRERTPTYSTPTHHSGLEHSAVDTIKNQETDRTKELTDAMEDLNREESRNSKLKDLLYGDDKIAYLNSEIKLIQRKIQLQKQYVAELKKTLDLLVKEATTSSKQKSVDKYEKTLDKLADAEEKLKEAREKGDKAATKKWESTIKKLQKEQTDLQKVLKDLDTYTREDGQTSYIDINIKAFTGKDFIRDEKGYITNFEEIRTAAEDAYEKQLKNINKLEEKYASKSKEWQESAAGKKLRRTIDNKLKVLEATIKQLKEYLNTIEESQTTVQEEEYKVQDYEDDIAVDNYEIQQEQERQAEEAAEKARQAAEEALQKLKESIEREFERIVYSIDLKIRLKDDKLKVIDFLMQKIGDKAEKAATKIGLMGQKLEQMSKKSGIYEEGVSRLLDFRMTGIGTQTAGLLNPEGYTGGPIGAQSFPNGNPIDGMSGSDIVEGLKKGDRNVIEGLKSKKAWYKEDVEQMSQWINDQLQNAMDMREIKDEAIQSIGEVFSEVQEQMDSTINKHSKLQDKLSHYYNMIDLVGRQIYGVNQKIADRMARDQVILAKNNLELAKQQMKTSQDMLDKAEKTRAEAQRQYQNALSQGNQTAAEEWKHNLDIYDDQLKEMREKQADLVSAYWAAEEAAAEAAMTRYEKRVNESIKAFSQAVAKGFDDFDQLQSAFDRYKRTHSTYVEDYEKAYRLSKLTRTIEQDISKIDNLKSKEAYLKLQDEINKKAQDGVKLSQYDLQLLEKKRDLLQAQAAFEEAQNNKTQVSLTRDNEGNYGYVYTANEEDVAKAEQTYSDKLYEMRKLNADYINELQSSLMQLNQNMLNDIQKLKDTLGENNENYQAELQRIKDDYAQQEADLVQQMTQAFGDSNEINTEYAQEYAQLTGDRLAMEVDYVNTWKDTVMGQLLDGYNSLADYQKSWTDNTKLLFEDVQMASRDWQLDNKEILNIAEDDFKEYVQSMNDQGSILTENSRQIVDAFKLQTEMIKDLFESTINSIQDLMAAWSSAVAQMMADAAQLAASFQEVQAAWGELQSSTDYADTGGGDDYSSSSSSSTPQQQQTTQPTQGIDDGAASRPVQTGGGVRKPKVKNIAKSLAYQMTHKKGRTGWSTNRRTFIKQMTRAGYSRTQAKRAWKQAKTYKKNGTKVKKKTAKKYNTKNVGKKVGKKIKSYATGGYTGKWGDQGKLAVLHEKELVLNQADTKNLLKTMELMKEMTKQQQLKAQLQTPRKNIFEGTWEESQDGLTRTKRFKRSHWEDEQANKKWSLMQKKLQAQQLSNLIDTEAMSRRYANLSRDINYPVANEENNNNQQQININADFPNATNKEEIRAAFENMIGLASQYANRKARYI